MSAVARLADFGREQFAMPFPERFGEQPREKSEAPILAMGTQQATEALHGALRRAFDGTDAPIKRIARAADSNTRTAENYWEGNNLPGLLQALRLMATVPEFAAEVRRLTGMAADLDPELERDFHRLMRTYWKAKEQGR